MSCIGNIRGMREEVDPHDPRFIWWATEYGRLYLFVQGYTVDGLSAGGTVFEGTIDEPPCGREQTPERIAMWVSLLLNPRVAA